MLRGVTAVTTPSSRMLQELLVPDRRHRIVPEVVVVRRWAVGVLGIWKGRVRVKGWDKGGGSVYKQPGTEVDGSCHS
jgi:hypothetical protein